MGHLHVPPSNHWADPILNQLYDDCDQVHDKENNAQIKWGGYLIKINLRTRNETSALKVKHAHKIKIPLKKTKRNSLLKLVQFHIHGYENTLHISSHKSQDSPA
jgi:hypothetical protein